MQGHLGDAGNVLGHRAQAQRQGQFRQAVEAHHRHLPRHVEAQVLQRRGRAHRLLVARGKQPGKTQPALPGPPHGTVAVQHREPAGQGGDVGPHRLRRRPESGLAVTGHLTFAGSQKGQLTVSDVGQLLGRQLCAVLVVGGHPAVLRVVSDEHHGHAARHQDVQASVVRLDVHQQHRRRKADDLRQLAVQVEQLHACRGGVGLQRPPEQHLIRAEQRVTGQGRQPQRLSGAPRQMPGRRVGHVVQIAHDLLDLSAGSHGHRAVSVQHPADGSLAHASGAGDVVDGRAGHGGAC